MQKGLFDQTDLSCTQGPNKRQCRRVQAVQVPAGQNNKGGSMHDLKIQQVSEVHFPLMVVKGAALLAVAQVVWKCITLLWVLLCMEKQANTPVLRRKEDVCMEQIPPGQLYLYNNVNPSNEQAPLQGGF